MIKSMQSIDIQDIPDNYEEVLGYIADSCTDYIVVEKDSEFGQYLVKLGYEFTKSWEWIVVFR